MEKTEITGNFVSPIFMLDNDGDDNDDAVPATTSSATLDFSVLQ
jgi:hypothetical protein